LTSISRPVTVSLALALLDLHQSFGIWKSPTKTPVAIPVSTNVKPVAPSPSSYDAVQLAWDSHFTSSKVTSKSLPREPNDNDSKPEATFFPT